jgi:glutamate synthase domain-containing protein 3
LPLPPPTSARLPQDLTHLRSLIQRHVKYTNSTVGRAILLDWEAASRNFVKVRGPQG